MPVEKILLRGSDCSPEGLSWCLQALWPQVMWDKKKNQLYGNFWRPLLVIVVTKEKEYSFSDKYCHTAGDLAQHINRLGVTQGDFCFFISLFFYPPSLSGPLASLQTLRLTTQAH